jgi:ABC-type polysaccharide/polyol phosphate transport system ATPase subunit
MHGEQVGRECGAGARARAVIVELRFPRMAPSASLSEGVVDVSRFPNGYRVWAVVRRMQRAMSVAIEVEQLHKRLGDVVALDGVDLIGPDGEVLALLGPNGAGKTTLVRALATLLVPDSGRAFRRRGKLAPPLFSATMYQ